MCFCYTFPDAVAKRSLWFSPGHFSRSTQGNAVGFPSTQLQQLVLFAGKLHFLLARNRSIWRWEIPEQRSFEWKNHRFLLEKVDKTHLNVEDVVPSFSRIGSYYILPLSHGDSDRNNDSKNHRTIPLSEKPIPKY